MTRPALLVACALSLVACGGAPPPAPEPAEPPSVCVIDPAKAESRRPKPDQPSCDRAVLEPIVAACNEGDPDACYQTGGCALWSVIDEHKNPAAIENARKALRVACDGGIAEACELRVGVAMQHGEPLPADGCADLIIGCHLGHEQSCFYCGTQDCS